MRVTSCGVVFCLHQQFKVVFFDLPTRRFFFLKKEEITCVTQYKARGRSQPGLGFTDLCVVGAKTMLSSFVRYGHCRHCCDDVCEELTIVSKKTVTKTKMTNWLWLGQWSLPPNIPVSTVQFCDAPGGSSFSRCCSLHLD